jgi:DNA-binding FrmR family transcriptional regulator
MSPVPKSRAGMISLIRDAQGDVTMKLDTDEMKGVQKRLRRAEGQIGGVIRMIEEGRDCADIVTQLAAASKAIDRAGFAVIALGLRQCLTDDPSGNAVDAASLEKLFLSLA